MKPVKDRITYQARLEEIVYNNISSDRVIELIDKRVAVRSEEVIELLIQEQIWIEIDELIFEIFGYK